MRAKLLPPMLTLPMNKLSPPPLLLIIGKLALKLARMLLMMMVVNLPLPSLRGQPMKLLSVPMNGAATFTGQSIK